MSSLLTVYAFDPGFRHGALISTTLHKDRDRINVEEIIPIHVWTQKTSTGIRADSPALDVFKFLERILEDLYAFPPGVVLIDFDPKSVYWRPMKLQAVQLGLMMGYFCHGLYSRGYTSVFLAPSEVRKGLGFRNNTQKEDLHEWIRAATDLTPFEGILTNADILDALLLGYLFSSITWRMNPYVEPTDQSPTAGIPGSRT